MFVHDYIRQHLLSTHCEITPLRHLTFADVDANRKQFASFVQLMDSRMRQGFFRYGPNTPGEPAKIDYLGHLQQCIADYKATGNLEYLVDCANSCRLEFLYPTHSNPHFTPVDDGQHARIF